MPPNPRDNLGPGQLIPLARVREVVENSLAHELWGNPALRAEYADIVVGRLAYFKLLAPDVEGANFGFVPHRVPVPPSYLAEVAAAGAPIDPDPIPQLAYCRCLQCCCNEGQGHKSAEYRSWEARQQR